ncbi:hypothetical protein FKP32DRAFT_1606998 [Trametes sanguinea]|nr:hypothetical protein FKP32DRAFT_1606998 [Trametes sanguinea]
MSLRARKFIMNDPAPATMPDSTPFYDEGCYYSLNLLVYEIAPVAPLQKDEDGTLFEKVMWVATAGGRDVLERSEVVEEAVGVEGKEHQDNSSEYQGQPKELWLQSLANPILHLERTGGPATTTTLGTGTLSNSAPTENQCPVGLTSTSTTTITIIIMVGVSFELPTNVREAIPESVLRGHLARCPVEARGYDRHLLFRPEALFPHRTLYVEEEEEEWVYVEPARPREIMGAVPCVGSYCRLVLPDRRRFTGRITRVVEYQRTRIILRVEHPYSPAIVTVAVPYPFYEGTRWWYVGLLRWFGIWTARRQDVFHVTQQTTTTPTRLCSWEDTARNQYEATPSKPWKVPQWRNSSQPQGGWGEFSHVLVITGTFLMILRRFRKDEEGPRRTFVIQ